PCDCASSLAIGSIDRYQPRLLSKSEIRFHKPKCAACHQCISRCDLPYQLLTVSPVSCGGLLPAHWMAVRYCESTTRRSSSRARGSELLPSSIAPPSVQKRRQ